MLQQFQLFAVGPPAGLFYLSPPRSPYLRQLLSYTACFGAFGALVSLYCKCLPNLVWGRISSRATQERHGDQHRQPRHDAGNSPEDPPPDSTQTPAAPAGQQSQQSRLAERRRQLCGSECMCSERMASGRSSFSQAPQGVAGGNPEAHGHGGSARAAPSQQKVRR